MTVLAFLSVCQGLRSIFSFGGGGRLMGDRGVNLKQKSLALAF